MDMPPFKPVSRFKFSICCISLSCTDCIRLIGVQKELFIPIRDAILKSGYTIREERPFHGSHQYRVSGNPWFGASEDSVKSRRLLIKLLACMAKNGWNLIQAADTSKKLNDKDSLYFELAEPEPDVKLFALSFNMKETIRLIDAPEYMRDVLKWAILPLNKIMKQNDYYGSYELKLTGQAWNSSGADEVHAKHLLCHILANFRAVGYRLYGSVDISGGEAADLESWIFKKVEVDAEVEVESKSK